MLVKAQLAVSAEEYFDFIVEHLIEELPKSMKKKIQPSDIRKGLKYRQTYHLKNGDFISKKEIVEFEYAKLYRLQMEIPDGLQFIEHKITVLDDGIEVSYEETLDGKKSASVFHSLRANKNKKEMKKRLQAIEEYIIANREEAN